MVTYKSIIERYCPNVKHNVPVEISQHEDGKTTEKCLHSMACASENGGCKNSRYNEVAG
ncbi:MAG: hypothetical protein K0R90_1090 [Oscillospiraceae bacterium]|nr:hypothetical protein [Oscillospiraceae bacterium]